MKLKLLGIFLVAALLIGMSESFAGSEITLQTDKESYQGGDTVALSGNLAGGTQGQLVGIEVKDAANETILIRTLELDSQGNFNLDFKVPTTATSGTFTIIVNIEVDGKTISQTKEIQIISERGDQGGCLIATATFGSELATQVQQLRELRDNTLLETKSGSSFMSGFNQFYYSFSPTVADLERQSPIFKETVKLVITPLLTSLSILNYLDIDSEEEVLGYGISIILLNIGMYFVAPTVVILKIKKRLE